MTAKLAAWVKGWKTVAFNAVAAVLPILMLTEVRDALPAEYLPWYALAVAVGNLILRHYTNTHPAYKAPKTDA